MANHRHQNTIHSMRRFETFIQRNEYERRMHKKNPSPGRDINDTSFSFYTRPVYPGGHHGQSRRPTLWNISMYHLSIGFRYYWWPLSIMYYLFCLPFICWVVHRHQIVLVTEQVLERQLHDGVRMLGALPELYDDIQLMDRSGKTRMDFHRSSHDAELPVSEMEMGRSDFGLPWMRGNRHRYISHPNPTSNPHPIHSTLSYHVNSTPPLFTRRTSGGSRRQADDAQHVCCIDDAATVAGE